MPGGAGASCGFAGIPAIASSYPDFTPPAWYTGPPPIIDPSLRTAAVNASLRQQARRLAAYRACAGADCFDPPRAVRFQNQVSAGQVGGGCLHADKRGVHRACMQVR